MKAFSIILLASSALAAPLGTLPDWNLTTPQHADLDLARRSPLFGGAIDLESTVSDTVTEVEVSTSRSKSHEAILILK